MRKLWIALIVFVPVMPKVSIIQLGAYPLLLDDMVLLVAVGLGVFDYLVGDRDRIFVSRVGVVFALFFAYKLINLLVLALINPWGGLGDRGEAVLFSEGVLVLSRVACLAAVYLLLFHYLRSRQDVIFAAKLYIASVACIVLYSLGQYFVLGHPVLTGTFRNIHVLGQIIPGVWGAENPWTDPSSTGHEHLGAFIVLALSIVGGGILYRYPAGKNSRRLAIALWLMAAFVLMMCSSRGSWIGALFAIGTCVLLAVKKRKTRFVFRGVVLVVLGLGALYWSGFNFSLHIGERVNKLPALLDGKIEDDSAKHRIHLLKVLWGMFNEKPLVGWGAGGGGRIVEGQIQREVIEGGLVGGLMFLFMVAVSGKIALAVNRASDAAFTQGLSFGYVCGLAGLMGQALFTELFILPKVIVPFWVIGAMVHRLYFIERQPSADYRASEGRAVPIPVGARRGSTH